MSVGWEDSRRIKPRNLELLQEKKRSFKRNKNDSISNGNILDILTLGHIMACIAEQNLSTLTLMNMSMLGFIQRKSRNLGGNCVCVLPQENLLYELH